MAHPEIRYFPTLWLYLGCSLDGRFYGLIPRIFGLLLDLETYGLVPGTDDLGACMASSKNRAFPFEVRPGPTMRSSSQQ